MKTSINLDDKTIKAIDDYRAEARPIPSLTKAIVDLLSKGLRSPTEEGTKIQDLALHIRDPAEGRGGTCAINLPYNKIKDLGFNDKDLVDLTIIKK